MSRTTQDPFDPCAEPTNGHGCPRPPLERLRFWNGRFLVARDLRDQQDDLIRRLEYHQHFAHGEGILCGFQVREHPREDCRGNWLVIEPGMGYDCCGRTLWSPQRQALEFREPSKDEQGEEGDTEEPEEPVSTPKQHATKSGQAARQERRAPKAVGQEGREDKEYEQGDTEPEEGEEEEDRKPAKPRWFVLACHVDCFTDPVPALYVEDLCDPIRHEHGRLREDVAFKVVPASEVPEECWPRHHPVSTWNCTAPDEDDCQSLLGDSPPCDQHCACGECLVLAAVWREPGTGRLRWSTEHRKVLSPPGNLTRITDVSWPHGGVLSTDEILKKHDGALTVRFSRRLQPAKGLKNGINPMTFIVSFLGATRAYEQIIPPEPDELHGRPESPRLSPNGRCAIFDLGRDMLSGRLGYGGSYLYIRLLCDFLVDCHGRSVSGAHLAGAVNKRGSGNGVQGGVFESWFYLRSGRRGDKR